MNGSQWCCSTFNFGFVDFEKAFDRVLTEAIRWAVGKLGVVEWLVLAVMSMYTVAKTVVRTVYTYVYSPLTTTFV